MCLLPSGLCVLQEFGRCYVGDMIYCSVSACGVGIRFPAAFMGDVFCFNLHWVDAWTYIKRGPWTDVFTTVWIMCFTEVWVM